MSIKIICAWCGKHLSGPAAASQTSHGICNKCAREARKELAAHKKRGKQ